MKTVLLGDVCEVVNGGTPDTKKAIFWGGNISWITPKDMGKQKDIYVSSTGRTITEQGMKNSSAKIITKNSIILSTRAPIGHLSINTVGMSTNQGCKGIIPSARIDTKYLYYFLKNSVELLNELGSGTTFKELSGTKLKSVVIPYFDISEQKRIVKKLDEAFAAIDKAKQNTEKNLKSSQDIFISGSSNIFATRSKGSEEKMLGEVAQIISGQSPRGEHYNRDGEGLPLYQGKKDFGAIFTADPTVWTTQTTKIAEPNDILISVRAPVGPTNIANRRINIGRGLAAIRPWERLDYRYLFHWLRFKEREITELGGGTTFQSINRKDIENLEIPYPDITEQKRIVEKLDQLSEQTQKLQKLYQNKLKMLEELRQSILKQAFEGKL